MPDKLSDREQGQQAGRALVWRLRKLDVTTAEHARLMCVIGAWVKVYGLQNSAWQRGFYEAAGLECVRGPMGDWVCRLKA